MVQSGAPTRASLLLRLLGVGVSSEEQADCQGQERQTRRGVGEVQPPVGVDNRLVGVPYGVVPVVDGHVLPRFRREGQQLVYLSYCLWAFHKVGWFKESQRPISLNAGQVASEAGSLSLSFLLRCPWFYWVGG